jgi:hypothetical protein
MPASAGMTNYGTVFFAGVTTFYQATIISCKKKYSVDPISMRHLVG